MRPMGSDGSAASSEVANQVGSSDPANQVAAPTPAPVVASDGEDELQGSDDLVVDEGEATPADVAASTATPPPRPITGPFTPPPIPGSLVKTPGPEPKGPPPAPPSPEPKAPPPAPVDAGHGPLLPALPILPEALSQRPRRPKRSKPWFEEVFDEDYLRTLPFMRADQTLREVEFISSALTAAPGAEILDVGCGYGRHAIELVQRGYNVTGLDLSLPLLIRAADEAQRRSLSVNFVHADMREMAFEKQFDGAYSMLTSFGYFDEETNLRVAERIGRALKPGKRFLLDIINRDYVVADLPVRVWWEGTGCVVLEEVDFNFHTSRINTHRSIVFEDGRQLEQELSVRAYSLHEIGRLLRQAGFRVIDVSGGLATRGDFFGSASRNLLIVAEKREDEA
jgi:SAM-dependent methyltransferase